MTEMLQDDYAELEGRFDEISLIDEMKTLIDWDSQVCAPVDAAEGQGRQTAYLSLKAHDILTRPDWAGIFERLETRTDLNDWQQANVREAKRSWIMENALSADLVARQAKAVAVGQKAWEKAKRENDFAYFMPHLRELVDIARETAVAVGQKTGAEPYDALSDMYQGGMTRAKLDVLFNDLKAFLPDFIKEVCAKQAKEPALEAFKADYAPHKQRAFAEKLMKTMGFDFNRGRLDMATSAFQLTCGVNDMRVVGWMSRDNPIHCVAAVMHETGHGLYEQGLPSKYAHQPVGRVSGMAMHESQSLLMEHFALQSDGFIRYLSKELCAFFETDDCAFDRLKRNMRQVKPSFIRVNADEATYPLHVILRYELEKALIDGSLDVKDLPDAWREKMRAYLGIEPPTDTLGCLQDIHWSCGEFGYFPDYTVGMVAAAQIFATAQQRVPEIPEQLGHGDFSGLTGWLGENIWAKALKLPFDEWIMSATGKTLSTRDFKDALTARYL